MSDRYFERLAAAYVRGTVADLPPELSQPELDDLGPAGWEALIGLGRGLRLHRFKKTMELPRVQKVLGTLKSVQPATLLDLGTGRGAFLWPLLDCIPWLPVTAVDRLEYRVADLNTVRRGGVSNLEAVQADITQLPFESGSFEVSTALEVLEHLPEPRLALAEMTRLARRMVILSVPSKPDDNLEHLHVLSFEQLSLWLRELGWTKIKEAGVLNHLIVIATN